MTSKEFKSIPKYDTSMLDGSEISKTDSTVRPEPIAPWLHTALLLTILALWATYSAFRSNLPVTLIPHVITYTSSIIIQTLLVGFVIAGLYHRRQFIAGVLGASTRHKIASDLAVGIGIFLGALIFVALIASMLRLTPLHLTQRHDVVQAMAPHSFPDLALWVLVSIAAGTGEEFVFRGYLQQQLTRWFRSVPVAIATCSLLFGCLHFYQGATGVLQVTLLGLIYGVVAARRGNLRSVMVAHALQDLVSGTVLFFRSH